MSLHRDDKPIVILFWAVVGMVVVGSMVLGGMAFWSLPYLFGWLIK